MVVDDLVSLTLPTPTTTPTPIALVGLFFQSAEQYADRVLVHLMATPALDDKTNLLFESNGTQLPPNPFLLKDNHQQAIMQESIALLDKALAVKSDQ